MKINTIVIGLFLVSILVLSGCAQQQTRTESQQEKVDLCNEIDTPSGSVNCQGDNCYLTLSGDSRVSYQVFESGVWGQQFNAKINAGDRIALKSNTLDKVEIVPWDDTSVKKCENRKIFVYRNQFTGDVKDNSAVHDLYNE